MNRFLVEKLVEAALPEQGGESALDLYAGVGLFALPMARRFRSVTAVETGSSAAHDLEFNASRAELAVKVEQARVEDYLERLQVTPEFVLADPPRAGLGKDVVGHLQRLAPPRIDDCFLRSGDAGSGSGGADRLSNRVADAGRFVPANVSFGSGCSAQANAALEKCLPGTLS